MRGSQTVDWSRAYGLMRRKGNRRIIASTAYSAAFARVLDPFCDLLLVDCDVANLTHGLPNRTAADLDMMLLHGKSVSRGAKRSAVAIELPESAWMQSPEQAFRSASRLLDETECCGVMLPFETIAIETTRFLLGRGIPVMSCFDISPAADYGLGRQFAEGENEWLRMQVLRDAATVTEAGVFAIVATGRNDALALQLSKAVAVPVIGAESASLCDGDLLRDVECLDLLNSVRRNADLSTRTATRPDASVSRSAGRATNPSNRSATGAGAADPSSDPRTAGPGRPDAGAPTARAGSRVAPFRRVDGVSKESGKPERPPVLPIRRPQPTGDLVGWAPAARSAFESPTEDPGPRTMSTVGRGTGAQAAVTSPSNLPAGSFDRLGAGRIMNPAEHDTRSATTGGATEPARPDPAPVLASSSDVQPPPEASGTVSGSLQNSLESLFGLDPASGVLPPRRLRPVDPGSDLERDVVRVERPDLAPEARPVPSFPVRRERPAAASLVSPITPPAVGPAAANPPRPEAALVDADTGAERRRAAARRVACRAAPVRRKPARGLVPNGPDAPARDAAPVEPPRLQVLPRLLPQRTAVIARPPSERADPERPLASDGEPPAGLSEGIGQFAVRAAGVVILAGVMIASGYGAASYLRSPTGEVRTEPVPAKTGSGVKGEFGAPGLAAHAPPRDAFAPRDRPVEVKILQTRPLF